MPRMNILPQAYRLATDGGRMWISLDDGPTIGVPLAWSNRVLDGSPEPRGGCFASAGESRWHTDEDIWIETLLTGRIDRTQSLLRAA